MAISLSLYPDMDSFGLLKSAQLMRCSALKVLDDLEINNCCHQVGGTVNIVGSLKTGLMLNHRDIDLHMYTEEPMAEMSFSFMNRIANNKAVRDIQYINLLDTKQDCIEWHFWFDDKERNAWKLDIIHIRKYSFYDGYFERVTDRIIEKLTPETKSSILQIKYGLGDKSSLPGIQICHAVLEHGIKNYAEFIQWSEKHPLEGILEWMP